MSVSVQVSEELPRNPRARQVQEPILDPTLDPALDSGRPGTATRARMRPGLMDGVFPAGCPSRVVLDHVTSKWGVLVLLALSDDTMRWGELRRMVQGVSEKMLAQTLQTLERDSLVHREALPVIPPHVEYSLTGLGGDLVTKLIPLMDWLLENSPAIVDAAARSSEQ